ncbi:nuclear cap-binding protein [Perkinsela sp. CCAP 1560/4]|nr:nuclear cap-binding protein [Perkinsela sp. CCAP 1560/4]|eukprot:KNH06683.1 nuclear cap-binding protein [Perkinsela sp. CCAP 1560/4]
MFPFIDPEKAAILAGNTLLPYAISLKNRVYIGNMGPDITPEDLRSALTPFGVVVNVGMGRLPEVRETDPEGISKGYCFVDFNDADSAEKLLNLDPPVIRIFGRLLRVVEPRFHLDNIEKERFMSVENAALLVQAGIIEQIESPGEVATPAECPAASTTE